MSLSGLTLSSHQYRSIVGMAVLAVSVLIVLLTGSRGLKYEEVEAMLQRFNAHVMQEATRTGREAAFTYGTIDMQGWGYDRHAIVSNVSLEISQKALIDTTPRLSFSTERMVVTSDPALPDKTYFAFPEPVNIIKNSQLTSIITPSAPIQYIVAESDTIMTHAISLPEQLMIAPVEVAGEGTPLQARTVMSFDPGPVAQAEINKSTGEMKVDYHIMHLKTVSGDRTHYTLGELSGHYTQVPQQDDRVSGKYEWRVTDMVFHEGDIQSKPISLALDATYTGDRSKVDFMQFHPSLGNAEMTIHKAALMGEDFNVIGMGQVSTADDDPLPYGNLEVEIENPGKLLASDLVPASLRSSFKAVLKKVAGEKAEASERASVALKRDKKGIFYIGGVTFEEVTATMLGNLLESAVPSAAPAQEIPQALPPLPAGAPSLKEGETSIPAPAPDTALSPAAPEQVPTPAEE